jgi:exonuclease III
MQLLPFFSKPCRRAKMMLASSVIDEAALVVFTEIVDVEASRIVLEALENKGFCWVSRPLQKWPRLNGGVLVTSRVSPFDHTSLVDNNCFISKGFVQVHWQNFILFATHLDSGPDVLTARASQVAEITAEVRQLEKHKKTTKDTPILLAGDFNVELRDICTDTKSRQGLPFVSSQCSPTHAEGCIDGVLIMNESDEKFFIPQQTLRVAGSDHWPVIADVSSLFLNCQLSKNS